jgi:hypothetical protein
MKNRISILLLIVVGLLAASCNDFLDVNKDPNNPTEVSPDLVLPVGLNYTASYIQMDRGLNHLGNMMMYNWGEVAGFDWYASELKYAVTSSFYTQMWNNAYSQALKQYSVLAGLSEEDGNGYYKAIGLIMEAYHFQILADLYGNIPYTDALERGSDPTPDYTPADSVYVGILSQLTEAVNAIKSADDNPKAVEVGHGDVVFGGNMTDWIRFDHTIKIRILSRVYDAAKSAGIDVNSELSTIKNSGIGYINDDVAVDLGYKKEEDQESPFWAAFGKDASGSNTLTGQATAATQFVLNFLQKLNDPRIGRMYEHDYDGPWKGVNQGFPNHSTAKKGKKVVSNMGISDPDNSVSYGLLKSPSQPAVIFTLAEQKFNMAELALKGYNVSNTAQNYYQEGIAASFEYLGVENADDAAKDYYQQSIQNVNWNASSNKLDAIMTQQWIATMGLTAAQSWFDYTRTGLPDAVPLNPKGELLQKAPTGWPLSNRRSTSHDDRPVRLLYPSSEITANPKHVTKQGLDEAFQEKVFWAK